MAPFGLETFSGGILKEYQSKQLPKHCTRRGRKQINNKADIKNPGTANLSTMFCSVLGS